MNHTDSTTTPAENAVQDLHRRLLEAWNRRNAREFADPFVADATVIGFDGSIMASRQQVETEIEQVFNNHPTARYVRIVREIRPLGHGAVLLRADVGMIPPGRNTINPDVNAIQVLIAVPSPDRGWRIAHFQNTPAAFHGRPELARALTDELSKAAERDATQCATDPR